MVGQEVTQGRVLCGVLCCFVAWPVPWPCEEEQPRRASPSCDAPAKRRGILSAKRTGKRGGYWPGTPSLPEGWAGAPPSSFGRRRPPRGGPPPPRGPPPP